MSHLNFISSEFKDHTELTEQIIAGIPRTYRSNKRATTVLLNSCHE